MVQAHRIKTVAVVGCTAVGKSETAIRLAKRFKGTVIGADSMQIYRGFDIGTGKLLENERCDVEHCMIDVADGDADYSVGEYVKQAGAHIKRVAAAGGLPIVVGGTGLYVSSLFSGCNFAGVSKDENTRRALRIGAHVLGAHALHALLTNVDARSAQKIPQNDVKRVIRAMEIYALGGAPKSEAAAAEKPYDDLTIVLTLPRELLYERINARVKTMFDAGLIDEARGLAVYKSNRSMQALGYKQIIENPDMPRRELEALVAQKTRNYAKRQMTYFNNMKLNKVFIDARDYADIESTVAAFIGDNNE